MIIADLILWGFPVEASLQAAWCWGAWELRLEAGALLDLLFLKGGIIKAGVSDYDDRFDRGEVFGVGPGGKAAVGLRWRLAGWSLGLSASYHISKLYYTANLRVPFRGGAPVEVTPRDLLQGVELCVEFVLPL